MSGSQFEDIMRQRQGVDFGYADDMVLRGRRREPAPVEPAPQVDEDAAEAQRVQEAHQRDEREQDRQDPREHDEHVEIAPVEAEHEAVLGGSSGGSSGAASSQQGASAPEAMPQREEPDEGEHSSSEPDPEPIEPEQNADEQSQQEVAPSWEPPVEDDDAADDDESEQADEDNEAAEQEGLLPVPKRPEGLSNLAWTETRHTHRGEAKNVARIPVDVIDTLRQQLEPFGAEFARRITNAALLSAFIEAKLGIEVSTDVNTVLARRAFLLLSPEFASLETKVSAMGDSLQDALEELKRLRKDVKRVGEAAEVVEASNAYLIADRYDVLPSVSSGAQIELRQPKVSATRKSLAEQTKKMIEAQKRAEARLP